MPENSGSDTQLVSVLCLFS